MAADRPLEDKGGLNVSVSAGESGGERDGHVGEVLEYAGEPERFNRGDLQRNFKARHVQMIALGANIGSGVLISSGKVGFFLRLCFDSTVSFGFFVVYVFKRIIICR